MFYRSYCECASTRAPEVVIDESRTLPVYDNQIIQVVENGCLVSKVERVELTKPRHEGMNAIDYKLCNLVAAGVDGFIGKDVSLTHDKMSNAVLGILDGVVDALDATASLNVEPEC